jgi:hypothetical protein
MSVGGGGTEEGGDREIGTSGDRKIALPRINADERGSAIAKVAEKWTVATVWDFGKKHKVPPAYSRADDGALSLDGRRDDDSN